jgi:hypothetical protein
MKSVGRLKRCLTKYMSCVVCVCISKDKGTRVDMGRFKPFLSHLYCFSITSLHIFNIPKLARKR